jgi:hypothetical protein
MRCPNADADESNDRANDRAVEVDPVLLSADGCVQFDVLLINRVALLTYLRDVLGFGCGVAFSVGLDDLPVALLSCVVERPLLSLLLQRQGVLAIDQGELVSLGTLDGRGLRRIGLKLCDACP